MKADQYAFCDDLSWEHCWVGITRRALCRRILLACVFGDYAAHSGSIGAATSWPEWRTYYSGFMVTVDVF